MGRSKALDKERLTQVRDVKGLQQTRKRSVEKRTLWDGVNVNVMFSV
jgi:hypothetical protein